MDRLQQVFTESLLCQAVSAPHAMDEDSALTPHNPHVQLARDI